MKIKDKQLITELVREHAYKFALHIGSNKRLLYKYNDWVLSGGEDGPINDINCIIELVDSPLIVTDEEIAFRTSDVYLAGDFENQTKFFENQAEFDARLLESTREARAYEEGAKWMRDKLLKQEA